MTNNWKSIKNKLHTIIFEADTPKGKLFDIVLIIAILLSVGAVMLDSIKPINAQYGNLLHLAEWIFTILFTIEYILRLLSVGRPMKYAKSFFGVIDLLAFLPTYLAVIIPGSQFFLVIRILRVIRIFRVLKILPYITEAQLLRRALAASRRKIFVFLLAVLLIVIIMGSMMYGYGLIAVPTGIVSVEIARKTPDKFTTQACPECSAEGHDSDAKFCKYCGADLHNS